MILENSFDHFERLKIALNMDITTEDNETPFKQPLGQKIMYNQQNNIANWFLNPRAF